MRSEASREVLVEVLRPSADCPPIETLIEAQFAAEPTAGQRSLLAHAESCPACAAELDLVATFDGASRSVGEEGEIETIVSGLRAGLEALPQERPRGRVIAMPAPRKKLSGPVWTRWAAAAMVVLGVGLAFRSWSPATPPPLPSGVSAGVVRGGELILEQPVGDLTAPPELLGWQAVREAKLYRAEIRDVAGDLLWSGESVTATLALPEPAVALLETKVSYSWSVVALDEAGRTIARSTPALFRIAH